jgi:transposase
MISDPNDLGDTLLLCKSEGRREKEEAIRSHAQERLIADLETLAKRVASGRLKDSSKIERAIGRVLAKHPRAARLYEVEVRDAPEGHLLEWRSKQEESAEDQELFGSYVLRTNVGTNAGAESGNKAGANAGNNTSGNANESARANPGANEIANVHADAKAGANAIALSPDEIWHTYMTLTRAESGFRALKSDLGLRPNRHHIERRVDAHVFITILAYHLLRFLLFTLESAGDNRTWQTINRILSTHAYTTIILPTTASGTLRIRKAGTPDESQKSLYRRWGINWRSLPSLKTRHP